jgi:hypothetical protein
MANHGIRQFEAWCRRHRMGDVIDAIERFRATAIKPNRPARKKVSGKVTPERAALIRRLHAQTSLTQHQIAAKVGVNPGRVAEVLNGQ